MATVLSSRDLLEQILRFVGPKEYAFVGGVNRVFSRVSKELHGVETSWRAAVRTTARVELAVKSGLPLTWQLFREACKGHVSVCRTLKALGCPWHSKCCTTAARYGNVEVLEFLRGTGSIGQDHDERCPWNFCACLTATANGHREVAGSYRASGRHVTAADVERFNRIVEFVHANR